VHAENFGSGGEREPLVVSEQLSVQPCCSLPNHHSIDDAVNIVYNIPMATVYGPGVAMPANSPSTLDINTDAIRGVILASGI
jgi:hypothetical protein